MTSKISIPQRLMGEALLISADKHPDKTLVVYKDAEYSYSYIRQQSEKVALYLLHAGIKKGDRVAVYMNNSWQTVIAIYGATLAGAVFLVINPQTKGNKLNFILNNSGTKVLLADTSISKLSDALENVESLQEVIVTEKSESLPGEATYKVNYLENILSADPDPVPFPGIIPTDLAALIYTSGSTGFPKGVMMTHQSMVFTSWSLIQYLRFSEDERIMLVLPLAFDYGKTEGEYPPCPWQ